jgi:4-oxalocrotonate tautomerase
MTSSSLRSFVKSKLTTRNIKGESMPLVRIDLAEGKAPKYGIQIGQIVYQALLDVMNAPKGDLFQIITEHPKAGLQFDRDFLGVHRSDDCIFVQITLNSGRTVEMKQRFYKAVADGLHESLKLRREDVFISLVEVVKENWSFGNGEAQYVPAAS